MTIIVHVIKVKIEVHEESVDEPTDVLFTSVMKGVHTERVLDSRINLSLFQLNKYFDKDLSEIVINLLGIDMEQVHTLIVCL